MKFILAIIALLFFNGVFSQTQEFPYKRNKKDFVLIPVSIGAYFTGKHLRGEKDQNLTMEEIQQLDRNDVNAFDRPATHYWNRSADKFSNVVLKVMPFAPIALAGPQLLSKKWDNTLTLGIMYVEVLYLTTGVTDITKSLVGRIRPYLYNTSLTVEERFNVQSNGAPTANTSFFSGHTSRTFAFAVLVSKTYTDIYGKGTWSTIIWSTSLTLASATAVTRVAAGEHFPTDVIVGALVGGAIGYFVPVLHKVNPEKLDVTFLPGYFRVAYKF